MSKVERRASHIFQNGLMEDMTTNIDTTCSGDVELIEVVGHSLWRRRKRRRR